MALYRPQQPSVENTSASKSVVSISRDKVIDSWFAIVEHGAGKADWVMDTTEQFIKDVNPPHISCERVAASAAFFGERRDFVMVTHRALREYAMYIGARDYGRDLDVSRFLTLTPSFLRGLISKYATGNPQALSMNISVFDHQDINAYTSIARHCLGCLKVRSRAQFSCPGFGPR